MPDDCCGGGGPAWPGPAPTIWPSDNYTGTTSPLPDVLTPQMQWEGLADASTILAGAPAFTPPDNPAHVTLVEVRNRRERLHHGFPNGCFQFPANCHQAFELEVIENWRFHAKMLEMSYLDVPTAAEYIQTFCPCLTRGVWIPNTENIVPGVMIAFTPSWTLVYISGTTTPQQKALQGSTSLFGPIFGDGFGTNATWFAAHTRIVEFINAEGIPARDNWFIAGHSYGGALAAILAGVVKRADPNRNVNLFTCGAPCPGDERLFNMLADVRQVALSNIGDPVCSMPPGGANLDYVTWQLTGGFLGRWQPWRPLRGRVALSLTGERTAVNEGTVEFDTLSSLVNAIVTGAPIADFPAHQASVYYSRASIVH